LTRLVRSGIGSLPHTDSAEAVEFVLATADVSYLPQLPNRHPEESMLLQWGDGIAGAGPDDLTLRADSETGPRHEAFVGAEAMLREPAGDVLKTQATGPVTLAAALKAGGVRRTGLLRHVADELVIRISDHLDWVRRQSDVEEVILVLDEPMLAVTGDDPLPAAVLDVLALVIEQIDADVGIHCCGDTDWGAVAALRPGWLSWDVAALGPGFLAGVDQISRALAADTRLMWGIVPTTPGPLPDQNVIVSRYGTAVANLIVAGAPLESLKQRAWFTPACGLAGLSVADAQAVVELLEEVVEEVEHGW
jgi:methionine synthase II (cobalamin-independent)